MGPSIRWGIAILPLWFSGAAAGQAVTYYVSPSGNDANPGTSPLSPWRTTSKVNGTDFFPGDRILFEAGRHTPEA